MKKSVTDYLFESLDRLSTAEGDNIQLEVTKAHSSCEVARQMLDISRHKLEILKTVETSLDFPEIASEQQKSLQISSEKTDNSKPH